MWVEAGGAVRDMGTGSVAGAADAGRCVARLLLQRDSSYLSVNWAGRGKREAALAAGARGCGNSTAWHGMARAAEQGRSQGAGGVKGICGARDARRDIREESGQGISASGEHGSGGLGVKIDGKRRRTNLEADMLGNLEADREGESGAGWHMGAAIAASPGERSERSTRRAQ